MIDLSGVIRSLMTGTYVVTRSSLSTYGNDGRRVAESTTTVEVVGCFQPGGDALERLPQGYDSSELGSFWTTTELKTRSSTRSADRVYINGADWEVEKVEQWPTLGKYWRCALQRLN